MTLQIVVEIAQLMKSQAEIADHLGDHKLWKEKVDDHCWKQSGQAPAPFVNVTLAYSCACYHRFYTRAEYWNPQTLMYRFLAEAKRVWELEAPKPRITTIQAGIIFNVTHNLCGLDEIGQAYRIHALALAHELQLFDGSADRFEQSEKIRNGWALRRVGLVQLGNVNTPISELDQRLNLLALSASPLCFLPCSGSLPPNPCQIHRKMQNGTARSQFRVIMNEACHIAYTKGSKMTPEQAGGLYSRLRSCMYYHNLILSIYEPSVDSKTNQNQQDSLQHIISDSSKCLQTLVRLYYLRHGFEAMDLFIVIPLVIAGFKCIDA
ncbi:C6 transcription factor [Diaporthe eres]|nr:C6 transcription factor [Diaporthe eres]